MAGTLSTRWFWSDWLSDPCLRACGYAARGLWMDMLWIAESNCGDERGFITLNGQSISPELLARMTAGSTEEVVRLLDELDRNGVFERTANGLIFCRRIVEEQSVSPLPPDWTLIRLRIFKRDDYTCQYCFERGGDLECDHKIPRSRGGDSEDDNLATACRPCNRAKGAKTPEEWLG